MDGEVHEVVERQAFMFALLADNPAAELAFEQIRNYRVVCLPEITIPNFGLLGPGLLLTINLLVLWLLPDSVEFIVHAVKEVPEKLLGVLLAVT